MSSSGSEEDEEGVGVDERFLDPRSSRGDVPVLWSRVAGERTTLDGEGVEETPRG